MKLGIMLLGAVLICLSNSLTPRHVQAATGLVATNGAGGQGTNAWGTPANAQGTADNNTYATASPANNARVAGIWNTYNFDSNLPLHAAITKVEIIAQYKVDSTLSVSVLEVQAVVAGTNCPTTPASDGTEPTTDTNFTVDVTSCRAWTRTNLLNANLGTRVTAFRNNSLLVGANFSLDYVQVRVTYDTPDYEQAAYRWYDNADSTATGATLANSNTAPTLYAPADRVRLRVLLHVTTTSLLTSSEQFKLQFAQKGASCTGLTYEDVTTTSIIAYFNNPNPASGATLTTGAQDPQHSTDTVIAQTYNEASPFNTIANTAVSQDGLWDVSLVGNGALANTAYCFRMVTNDGSALTTYNVYPELITSPTGSLGVDIVDAAASSVLSPLFGFGSVIAPVTCTSSSTTLGTSSQRIRVKNTTATPGWSLTLAATSGNGALWSAGTPKYDFNDGAGTPAGCSAGLDSDTYGGQMTINASGGTVTPRAVSACNNTGISKGSSAAFSEGTLNAITLMNGSASAPTGCFWELTNVSASQQIPGGQSPGAYNINMTLTIVAN
ncbi:MAG: hypothetical protein ACR2FM_01425 [Candidatus Saccharimonadales bacterium]